MAKLCSPAEYDENALELAALLRRGDLALPNLDVDPRTGDFDRAAEEKGDDVDVKASNPERFVAEAEEDSPEEDKSDRGGTGVWLMGKGADGDDLLDENIFWPLTAAKGELEDAYAIKPLSLGAAPDFFGDFGDLGSGGGDGLLVSRGLSSLSASSRGRLRGSRDALGVSWVSGGP